jgi:hypothetical protein
MHNKLPFGGALAQWLADDDLAAGALGAGRGSWPPDAVKLGGGRCHWPRALAGWPPNGCIAGRWPPNAVTPGRLSPATVVLGCWLAALPCLVPSANLGATEPSVL